MERNAATSCMSWLVLLVVTIIICLEIGIIKGFSVLLPDLKEQLTSRTWVIGSGIGIITGWGYVVGLSASLVVKYIGARYGILLSGLASSLGLIICANATNAYTVFAGQIFTGFLLLQENLAIGVVSEYFTGRQYKTAASVYSCGTGLGIVILPLLTQMLRDKYGFRGALLLLSGICLQLMPFCAIVLKPKISKMQLLLPSDDVSNKKPSRSPHPATIKGQMATIAASLGAHLLLRPSFIVHVLIPGFAWGYSCTGWMIYIVSFGLSNDASLKESTIVSTCGGLGMVLSRVPILPLLHTVLTNKELMYFSSALTVITLVLTTQFVSFIGMTSVAVVFGVGIGILGAELYIAAKEVAGKDEHYHTVAWLHVSYGGASLLSSFVSGLLFDMTASFTISFYVMAAVSLLTLLSLGLADIYQKLNNQWRCY